MKKEYLLTAGPTPVPERVMLAMAQPMVFHRSPAFAEIEREAQEGLQWIFQTRQPVITLVGSGTAGMEASISNFFSPGDRVLVIRGGRFGERWGKMCEAFGLGVVPLDVEWGRAVDPMAVQAALDRDRDLKAVFATASESSTGVAHPISGLGAVCRGRDALLVVDAISALGAFDLAQDRDGIDVLVGSSQKALMLPPGLAFVGASSRAWERAKAAKLPRFYFDLLKLRKNQEKGEPTWTPAVSLVRGLRESFRMMREEGLEALFSRHARLQKATLAACRAMGFAPFAAEAPSPSVTAAKVPAGLDGSELVKRVRTQYGVTISGGQEQLKGKIIRIAHMGYFGPFDILTAVAAVEMAAVDLGARIDLGVGARAAQQVLRS